jgi:hypothetical protein
MVNRTPRSLETRETGERKSSWKRSSMLPTPDPRDGISFRWIRTSTLGNADMTNVSRRFREHYTPVLLIIQNFIFYPTLILVLKTMLRLEDCLLCSIPTEFVQDRIEGQLQTAQNQSDAVDRNYMRESDPRMPVLRPERSSKTSFGR